MDINKLICDWSLFYQQNYFSSSSLFSYMNSTTLEQSKQLIVTSIETLQQMAIDPTKMQNLDPSTVKSYMNNFQNLDDFINQETQTEFRVFLYPQDSDPNFNLTIYVQLLNSESQIAFFRSKYKSYINFDIYVKSSGILGSAGDLESIMPKFIGKTVIRKDDGSILLGLELTDEAIVYGVAMPAENCSSPYSNQVANGHDGNESNATAFVIQKTTFDSNYNLAPVTLKFTGLQNKISYNVYFVAGLPVPREPLVSKNVINVTAMPVNPTDPNKKRVLVADEY